jgi:hypothetical protein
MAKWPNKPFVYQINTVVWLSTLTQRYGRPITLADVPDEVLDEIASLGIDAVWFMGIWYRSPAGRASALNYIHEYRPVLPDLTEDDVIGSAYAIGAYEVDPRVGGRDSLAALRLRLKARGILIMLDFVPNHTATDHEWIERHPDYYVQGTPKDQRKYGDIFFTVKDSWERPTVIAHGRDPYFPPWIDTAQLNAFAPSYRRAALHTLLDIAAQCDGVRCDMAMLMLNHVFQQTWGRWLGDEEPETEFWAEVIGGVKARQPDFLFIAEVYWGMEQRLQELGFDHTYDKVLYDLIVSGSVEKARSHLTAMQEYQRRTVRFIENHDEPRAYSHIGPQKSRAGAVLAYSTPGMVLIHDGQLIGRRVKLPVQIARQPDEPVDHDLLEFYRTLLRELRAPVYHRGTWTLFECTPASEEDGGHQNLLAYGWYDGTDYRLIVVNLTPHWSRALIAVRGWNNLAGGAWTLADLFGKARPQFFTGDHLLRHGLMAEVESYSAHLYRFERSR